MAGQYQDSDGMFGVMYDDGEAERAGPKDFEPNQDARGDGNGHTLQACGGGGGGGGGQQSTRLGHDIQHQIRTLQLQKHQQQQQQRTSPQRSFVQVMQTEEECSDDDDDYNVDDDMDDMDDEGGDDGGVGLDDGVDDGVEEGDNIEPQRHDTDARTGEASIRKWGLGEDSDGDGDGAIRFELKKIAIENVSTRLRAMADARNPPIRKCPKLRGRKMTPGRKRKKILEVAERKGTSIRKNWKQDLRILHRERPNFFTSQEATLEDESPAIKGKPAYSALPLTQFNNADVQEIFVTEYDRKARNGSSSNSFAQLLTVAGQYLRLHIVLGHTDVNKCWEPGRLYKAVCDRESIDIFLNYYDAKGQCTTVMTKALHLRKMAEYAKTFFSDRDVHLNAEAERSRIKLQKVYNTHKGFARSRATHRKQLDERIAEGTVFLEDDFRKSFKIVKGQLDGLIRFFQNVKASEGIQVALDRLNAKEIMQKWSMNMLLVLIFSAAGQRPQVYANLQCPDDNEIRDMQEQAGRLHFFEMRTTVEKTRRKSDFPNVLVHESALKYVVFQKNVVRPILVQRSKVDERAVTAKPLLMHTENGSILNTSQVTRVLKDFLEYYFPDLNNITMMSLRSSYGTMMMAAYRDKRLFRGLDEESFLGILGKIMNTSVEQLMTTYIGVDRSEFEQSARELNRVLNLDEGTDGSGNVTDGDDSFL